MLPFRLTCLGPPQLVGPDGEPVRLRTRKHLGLLVYLAIEPSVAHRRDRLATLLWPEAELEEGRHSLATGLSVLRGRLGADAFETTRDTIRLLPGRVVTDVALLLAADPLEHDTLVAGTFLDEFEIPRAPDFEHWIDTERARLLPLVHDHLVRRIDHCRRTGDTRRMEQTAEQLARIDGLSEHAIRALVESRAMAGDRMGALRVFDRWRARAAEELGAGPGRELERMTERLRRRGLDHPAHATIAPVPTEQWQERIFIGRGAEYQACYQAWERVRCGEPRHVLVRGESGIGKTTLVGRVATSLALEGASVARVQGYELERELPFGVIGSLVTALLDLPGASATAPAHLAELARLVAKVRQRWPSLPEPSASTGEGARIQFTEAVMALLAALAEEHPVVLLIDDLHLADATSLAVLHLILRRTESLPLMVMMTSSSREEAVPPAAARFVEQADGIRTDLISLGPLPEVHVTELLDALLGGAAEPGPTVRRALLAGASGNPMLLELLVEDWRRRGEASLALTVSAMTAEAAPPPAATFRRLVEGMLESLDREARAVAELAAILGQRLNDLSMYTLVDLSVARTMRGMTTLTAQRVLRDAGHQLEFTNEVVRGHTYLTMAAPLRRMLHSLVADRLLGGVADHEPIPGLELAWHLVRADRLAEAVPFLLEGGREAIRRGAPHEADLALSTGLPALTGQSRRTAILLLAEALQELGRWTESLRVLEAPGERFEEHDLEWRDILRTLARRWLGQLQLSEVRASIGRLLSIAKDTTDPDTGVKALAGSVRLLGLTREPDDHIGLRTALERYASIPLDDYQLLHVRLAQAWLMCMAGNQQGAEQLLGAASAGALALGFRSSIVIRLLVGQGNVIALQGRYDDALPPLTDAEFLSRSLDNPSLQAECATQLAMVHGRLGNRREQIDFARRALRQYGDSGWSPGELGAWYELGLGLAMERRSPEALTTAHDLIARLTKAAPRWVVQASLLSAADVFALAGDWKSATKVAGRAIAMSENQLLNPHFAGIFARWIAQLAVERDDALQARDALREQLTDVSGLHVKDRVEVSAAFAILSQRLLEDTGTSWSKVERELESLPEGVRLTLKALGCARGD